MINQENICGDNIGHYLAARLPESKSFFKQLLDLNDLSFFDSKNGEGETVTDIIKQYLNQ